MSPVPLRLQLTSPPRFYHCEPAWNWRPPPLVDHDLWCVLRGRGSMQLNGASYPLHAGTCFVLAPGDRVQADHEPRARLRVFAVHFAALTARGQARALPAAERPPPGRVARDLPQLEALARGLVTSQREGGPADVRCALYLRLLLLHLVGAPAPAAGLPPDSRVAALLEAVAEDPGHPWTVASMAQQVHLSRAQFTRRCLRETGLPPAQAVIRARLERAHTLLRETDLRIHEIAAALGYRDVFYFSRQFKQLTGHPPSALRRPDHS